MISKQPSRHVSQLDLKFLDLKFLTVDDSNPKNLLNSSNTQIQNSSLHHDYNKSSSTLRFETRQNFMPSLRGSFLKKEKKNLLSDERTADMSQNVNDSLTIDNDEINAESVINYLNVDSEAIYKEFGNRAPNLGIKKKKDHLEFQTTGENSDTIDREIMKYQEQIKRFQKENELIHKEITKMYSEKKKDNNLETKNIRNMKVFQKPVSQHTQQKQGFEQHYSDIIEAYRYESKDENINKMKDKFMEKLSRNSMIGKENIELLEKEARKKEQLTATKMSQAFKEGKIGRSSSIETNSENESKKFSQSLSKYTEKNSKHSRNSQLSMVNKYENFYEELYKPKDDKMGLVSRSSAEKDSSEYQIENNEGETLEELKKAMTNNNFDKNFGAFLVEKKIRVPEFLKNLR